MQRFLAVFSTLVAMVVLTGCQEKATLDRTQVEFVTREGRRFEVRLTPADAAGEHRLLVVRATAVINPDPEGEHQRTSAVARQIMDRTCRGGDYQVLEDNLVANVNLQIRFRCQA